MQFLENRVRKEKPLGTAGCLYLLKNKDILDPIIIINGDVLTDMNYRELIDYHNKSNTKVKNVKLITF